MTPMTTSSVDRTEAGQAAQDSWSLAARAEASLAAVRARSGAAEPAQVAGLSDGGQAGSMDTPATGAEASDCRGQHHRQMELDGICETLRQTDVFANLEEGQLRRLARSCAEQVRPAGKFVFRSGDPSDAVFVVRAGSVDVLRDQRGRPLERLARLNGGDIFGELGVLHGVGRAASVRTAEPCCLLRIGKETFRRLLAENAATEAKLEALAARRHCDNAAAALHVRTDVRIRIDARMILLPAAEDQQMTHLEDVSQGGLSLTDVPASWLPELPVSFTLIAGDRRLCVTGRIAWRRGETIGLAFSGDVPGHGDRVSRFTRALLEELL